MEGHAMKNTLRLALAVLFCIVLCLGIGADAWAENCTITFSPNGGYGSMEPQSFILNEPFAINANEFTRTNYVFAGWLDEEGNPYTDGQRNVRMTKNHNLTAQWKKAYYSVTYINPDDNTGKAYTNIPTSNKVEVIECPFEARQGKIFAEWNTVKNPTLTNPGVSYQPGEMIGTELNEITKEPKDIMLYAIWKDYVTVYFYPADGSYETQNVPVNTDTKLTTYSALLFKDKTPEGQNFAYWVDAVGTKYFNGQEVNLADNLILEAVYGNSIDLVYNANGGTITHGDSTGTSLRTKIAKDREYQFYTAEYLQLKRSGYKFLGWALGSGADMPKTGWEVENEPLIVAFPNDTTLYAVWESKRPCGRDADSRCKRRERVLRLQIPVAARRRGDQESA